MVGQARDGVPATLRVKASEYEGKAVAMSAAHQVCSAPCREPPIEPCVIVANRHGPHAHRQDLELPRTPASAQKEGLRPVALAHAAREPQCSDVHACTAVHVNVNV